MTNFALSGLIAFYYHSTQGSAALHPGLRVHRPFGTKVRGAKKIVVSVKGGENVSVPMIRDLAHVIDREKASFGFFVTLAQPTSKMKEEAIGLGYYKSDVYGPEYPKLQILTIEGLMSGVERPRFPDLTLGRSTFKRAAVEDGGGEQGRLL